MSNIAKLQRRFWYCILEAAACKIPSIATDIPGPRDFIKHLYNGYLIRPYSVNDIKSAMDYFSTNPVEVRKMAINAYNKAISDYDSKNVMYKFMHEFQIN